MPSFEYNSRFQRKKNEMENEKYTEMMIPQLVDEDA